MTSAAALRVALWQGLSPAGDAAAALAQAGAALRAAAAAGASVLVLPELWVPGYNCPDLAERALAPDAAPLRALAAAAADAGCTLVAGWAECAEGRLWNAATCWGPDGAVLAHYRKLQLYGPRERALFAPGAGYCLFDLAGRRAALLICYDVEFAPHVAALAGQGAELLLVPTANMVPFHHVPRHTVPAMAANHGVAVVYANYCGCEGDLVYAGASVIAGPHGETLARAGEGPALLVADLPARDPARLSTQAADLRLP